MTRKQKIAANKMVENGGNASKAMRDAGYSVNTAKTPSKLTHSKGFNELVDDYLNDDYLLSLLKSELNTAKNKKPYLEMAFKLKGRLQSSTASNMGNDFGSYHQLIEQQRAKYLG